MGSFSDHLENELLDHVFGNGSYTPPTIYVALSTANPLDDGSGLAEPSGNGYSRVQTAAPDWSTASSGSIDNAASIEFSEATGSWGTVTHFALMDAASGGNMLVHGALSVSKSIDGGDTTEFAVGDMQVSLD